MNCMPVVDLLLVIFVIMGCGMFVGFLGLAVLQQKDKEKGGRDEQGR